MAKRRTSVSTTDVNKLRTPYPKLVKIKHDVVILFLVFCFYCAPKRCYTLKKMNDDTIIYFFLRAALAAASSFFF